jgi:hypothetical protein
MKYHLHFVARIFGVVLSAIYPTLSSLALEGEEYLRVRPETL